MAVRTYRMCLTMAPIISRSVHEFCGESDGRWGLSRCARPTQEVAMATTASTTRRQYDLPAPAWLAVATNSFHTWPLEDALAGIAAAGFSSVELASIPGWTEHVPRDPPEAAIARIQALLNRHHLTATALT